MLRKQNIMRSPKNYTITSEVVCYIFSLCTQTVESVCHNRVRLHKTDVLRTNKVYVMSLFSVCNSY